MKVEYLPTFIKDMKKLKKQPIYFQIKNFAFNEVLTYKNVLEIKNLKKIKGSNYAYRVRVKDYRIGIFVENDIITFSRVLHRKEIYRYFP